MFPRDHTSCNMKHPAESWPSMVFMRQGSYLQWESDIKTSQWRLLH